MSTNVNIASHIQRIRVTFQKTTNIRWFETLSIPGSNRKQVVFPSDHHFKIKVGLRKPFFITLNLAWLGWMKPPLTRRWTDNARHFSQWILTVLQLAASWAVREFGEWSSLPWTFVSTGECTAPILRISNFIHSFIFVSFHCNLTRNNVIWIKKRK